jgi:hypothetical protein
MIASMTRTVSALSGEVGKQKEPAQLRPLDKWEKWAVLTFWVTGAILIAFSVIWYGGNNGAPGGTHSTLVSKLTTTMTVGTNKTVTETTYSDSFLIFTLTTGVLFLLAAGFYGRVRDITLGAVKVELEEDEAGGATPAKAGAAVPDGGRPAAAAKQP